VETLNDLRMRGSPCIVSLLVVATSVAIPDPAPSFTPPVYTLDLDEPAASRWDHIAKDFVDKMPAVIEYFDSFIPAWVLPLIEVVAGQLTSYFSDYGEEMIGVAEALKVPKGLVVMLNLVMQLEAIGVNCSNWNTTGPTQKDDPGCVAVDPSQKWCYCDEARAAGATFSPEGITKVGRLPFNYSGPGLCTSVVAEDPSGKILLGRNLDWNLPKPVRELLIDIDFVKGGKKLFRGTGAAGIQGVVNGMSYSGAVGGREGRGWAASINARGKGGKLLPNMLQSLLVHSMTPTQHLRKVLETTADFEGAISDLSSTAQIDENYFIVAGTASGEGAVVTRGRERAVDVWRLNHTNPDGWFRLQTNFDHWNPVPVFDDRRNPGIAHMKALGQANLTPAAMWAIIETWPNWNDHTDYSLVTTAADAAYNSTVWMQE